MTAVLRQVKGIGTSEEPGMRVSKEQAAQNRKQILTAAARLFRENGIRATGVDSISQGAGLTHGAFYSQFDSKESKDAVDFLAQLVPGDEPSRRREDAIAAFACMTGALILARAVDDKRFSGQILDAAAKRVIRGGRRGK